MHDDPATTQSPHVRRPDDPAAVDPVDGARPVSRGDQPSLGGRVCPFLRSIDDADRLGAPVGSPDPANRCAALADPVPQSLRQQELVCLTSGHINCPRYMRGVMGTTAPVERVPTARIVTPAIAASALALVGAFVLSLVFVVANGGLMLTGAASPGLTGGVLGEVETAPPTGPASSLPSAGPSARAGVSPSPTPGPSPTPTASPTATLLATPLPTATPASTAKPTPGPTSGRYALLKPCSDAPKCYVYVVRSGDNLYSIVKYFGVSLGTVKTWNPWTANGLKVGRGLRIPPPTR